MMEQTVKLFNYTATFYELVQASGGKMSETIEKKNLSNVANLLYIAMQQILYLVKLMFFGWNSGEHYLYVMPFS